ncbi:MAG: ribonucleoside-diphosphate reductase subunit alpha [Acidobacteria bacterium]|nr:ribonucleoside-diphosphate reductase subunit alpha [Acidobacteriota bacterium]
MQVRKRNGDLEFVDLNKIVRAVGRCCEGLLNVDALRVATKTISGLYNGATTQELDQLSIQTAASLIVEDPEYSRLAARLLSTYIEKEVANQEIHSFSQSIRYGHETGLINERTAQFVAGHARKLNNVVDSHYTDLFEFFGLRTVYDRYLLKDPTTRRVIETPQYFFLRVACGLAESISQAIELYNLFASLSYIPATPTLFNSGRVHEQLSSCYLLDSPVDDLAAIYDKYKDVALLSKFAGGIGIAFSRVRSRNSYIKGTNGKSLGIVPFLKTLDSSIQAVNQGGLRKGACCVYLEPWHADIEDFLELRENTGNEAHRTHNLNLAHWIPDLFMQRVQEDGLWSLFDPKEVPCFPDLFSDGFDEAYQIAERKELYVKQVKARDLYARMMRSLAQTGNGWMNFKDASNRKCNQTGLNDEVVHLSNLCTEIIEVTSATETAVCNLGSINLSKHVSNTNGQNAFDFGKLRQTVQLAIPQLDRVIDLNYYPIPSTQVSNTRWRNVGLGVMGLQDVFFMLGLPFDSEEARDLSKRIAEEIYFTALETSCQLAQTKGQHPAFPQTRIAQGQFQFDLWGIEPTDKERWNLLREKIRQHGLRNSLMIAVAPTATIASIAGCYECIEPQVSNLFKRETLSGDFIQINRYLVQELKALGKWDEEIRTKIKLAEGSIQDIEELPAELREIYRTAWEIPMRSLIDIAADRGAFIDQSQSLNLFAESPNIGKLSSMYMYAWQKGLKTTYYLRSRPATRIAKTAANPLTSLAAQAPNIQPSAGPTGTISMSTDIEAVACSLESPESCEVCQ